MNIGIKSWIRRWGSRTVVISVLGVMSLAACSPVGTVTGIGAAIGVASIDERGLNGTTDDALLRAEINGAWASEDTSAFTNVGLMIHGGYVVLTGTVAQPAEQIAAAKLAQGAKGVKQVYDHIRVDPTTGVTDMAEDSKIVASMRRSIFFDCEVLSINYNIDASGQTLFLQGIAQDMAEKHRVLAHAYDISGVRSVVEYIRIKEPEAINP